MPAKTCTRSLGGGKYPNALREDFDMSEVFIVCPIWPKGERQGHRYRPYFDNCSRCGIKIALNENVNRERESHRDLRLLCPNCADSELVESEHGDR